MERKQLPYGTQSIDEEDIEQVVCALRSDFLTRGPFVEAFEKAVAEKVDALYAVAFSSGSAALRAACHAAKVCPFDQVVTTPNSFFATVGAPLHYGAQLQFVDITRRSGNLDLKAFSQLPPYQSSRGKQVVIPVHFGGVSVDMEALDRQIQSPLTVVIEDAAHAIGSTTPSGEPVGSCRFSQMTIFSFHPVKTITTGEGGMVTTNDPNLYFALKQFRNNGIVRKPGAWRYDVVENTGNSHLTDIQAALGLSQLKKLDAFRKKRSDLVSTYRQLLSDLSWVTLFDADADKRTCYHLFVVQIDFSSLSVTRNEVIEELKKNGIGTQVHYTPLYRHTALQSLWIDPNDYPEMETYSLQALTLPLFPGMEEEDVTRVVETLVGICQH